MLLGHKTAWTQVAMLSLLLFRCGWSQSINRFVIPWTAGPLPLPILHSLRWLTTEDNVCKGIPFRQSPLTRTIVTDASLLGWGVNLGLLKVQGCDWNRSWSFVLPTVPVRHLKNTSGVSSFFYSLTILLWCIIWTDWVSRCQCAASRDDQNCLPCFRENITFLANCLLDIQNHWEKFLPEPLLVSEAQCPADHFHSLGNSNDWLVHHKR